MTHVPHDERRKKWGEVWLSNLQAGWDGAGARPMHKKVVQNVQRVIKAGISSDFQNWVLFPDDNGTLLMQSKDGMASIMSFVGPRPDVPGYADQLQGEDRDVLKLRPGITGPATLKYRLEDEMISEYVSKQQAQGDTRPMQEIAIEYNDTVIYPDKVRLNCYYYHHYSFIKDIQMILCTVLGKKMEYAGEVI